MSDGWVEPDDWMDWARKRAEDMGVDIDAPIRDTAGDWSKPHSTEGSQRVVIFAREIAVRNNALKDLGDIWKPDEEQSIRIWRAGISVLPMRVFHTYSDSARDDICSMASSLMWQKIKQIDSKREPITPDRFFRHILQAARRQISRGLSVPAELWGDVCQNADTIKTGQLFKSDPAWLALKKDGTDHYNRIVDDLVHTWESMLSLVSSSRIRYNQPGGHLDRHRKNYRGFVVTCISLSRKVEEWQDGLQKN